MTPSHDPVDFISLEKIATLDLEQHAQEYFLKQGESCSILKVLV